MNVLHYVGVGGSSVKEVGADKVSAYYQGVGK